MVAKKRPVATLVGILIYAGIASGAHAFTIPHFTHFKFGIFKVTVGMTGQASENASGINCTSGYTICSENDSASYHVDITYPYVELLISGKLSIKLPMGANNTKHVVNGSFNENGTWSPDGQTTSSFSCNGALSAITAEGGSDNLSWHRQGSGYSFDDLIETYGFDGVGHGSQPCNNSAWFGGGRLEYKNELSAFFTISKSELSQKSFTKIVTGPDSRYREPSTCLADRPSGTCEFSTGWHAVIKFTRTRLVSS